MSSQEQPSESASAEQLLAKHGLTDDAVERVLQQARRDFRALGDRRKADLPGKLAKLIKHKARFVEDAMTWLGNRRRCKVVDHIFDNFTGSAGQIKVRDGAAVAEMTRTLRTRSGAERKVTQKLTLEKTRSGWVVQRIPEDPGSVSGAGVILALRIVCADELREVSIGTYEGRVMIVARGADNR